MFINQKRVKLESLMNAASNGLNPLTHVTSGDPADSSPVRSPQPLSQQQASFPSNVPGSSPPNGGSSTSSSVVSRRSINQNLNNVSAVANNSLLGSLPGLFSSTNGTQNSDDLSSAMAAMANYLVPPPQDDSPNALFGRLVANELDKLPPGVHNIARAQILLLLAQTSQQSPSSANTTTDRILAACLTP